MDEDEAGGGDCGRDDIQASVLFYRCCCCGWLALCMGDCVSCDGHMATKIAAGHHERFQKEFFKVCLSEGSPPHLCKSVIISGTYLNT